MFTFKATIILQKKCILNREFDSPEQDITCTYVWLLRNICMVITHQYIKSVLPKCVTHYGFKFAHLPSIFFIGTIIPVYHAWDNLSQRLALYFNLIHPCSLYPQIFICKISSLSGQNLLIFYFIQLNFKTFFGNASH